MVTLRKGAVVAKGREHRHLPMRRLGRAPDAGIAGTGARDHGDTRAYLLDPIDQGGHPCRAGRMRPYDDDDSVAARPGKSTRLAVAPWRIHDRAREAASTRLEHRCECLTGYGVPRLGRAREHMGSQREWSRPRHPHPARTRSPVHQAKPCHQTRRDDPPSTCPHPAARPRALHPVRRLPATWTQECGHRPVHCPDVRRSRTHGAAGHAMLLS